ncbi:Ribosomal RNA small subunit methyltransferase I [Commensalibacter sp. Nvir]|uniref:16S rRNA (cytidine(1402)-2'-O)-methyltransferase n=1 Tax=Commensalibacter sp. Nvir TaxID=3069817 RepID=UPI002D63BF98|nr:Ribosomal RNA small subunit methyltransferase I [Commensalibacter sp. Nvir]
MINTKPHSSIGELILISTPIGNLNDFSLRAKETLKTVDLLLCEDTRITAKLLSAYSITLKMESLHEHNESQRINRILMDLKQGKKIALVSDAGTPLLSDPGYRLVRAVIEKNYDVTAIPGPNAAIMALTLSGLPPYPYMFVGFPPTKSQARQTAFGLLKGAEHVGLQTTFIWHEAPHRLTEMLEDLSIVFGEDRQAAVARELTKKFEDVQRGTLKELSNHYSSNPARGELTVLLGPNLQLSEYNDDDLKKQIMDALTIMSVKDASNAIAKANHLPKKIVYQKALELSKQ